MKEIYLAGGCFWGVEAYFSRIDGVIETTVGYANGKTESTTYYDIPHTGHSETVFVKYDPKRVSLETILEYYFNIIDPLSVNKQGNDIGTQYRTGIYYVDVADKNSIDAFIKNEQKKYSAPIAVEVLPLKNYILAEEYHQDYLAKNPNGYCHIDLSSVPSTLKKEKYERPSKEELKEKLTDIQYKVTMQNATEPPFKNEYWDNHKKGMYVDIVTGKPLFVSSDKFDSGCGWPSFSKPIDTDVLIEKEDKGFGMRRTEVRSKVGDTHLGHVFEDGPIQNGGLRYCINSAALRFIPVEEMEEKGYSKYIDLVK